LTLRRIVVALIVGFLFVSMTSSGVIGYPKNTDVEPSRGEDHGSDISKSISEIAAQQDNYNETEPNDNRSNADRISTGISVSGSGFINGSDVDWYAFNVTAGNAFNVEYSGQTVDVSVYGPAGNLIRSESAGTPDTWSVGGVADQSGTYYVRVTPDGGFGYGIAIKTAGPDQFEQNDDRSAAASIEPNQQLNPNLFAGEQDWYAVEADSGQTVTAVVERLSGALDPWQNLRVDIFNEDGELVSEPISNESFRISGENETIYSGGTISGSIAKVNVSDTQSGTYYVRISGVEELSGFIDYALTTNTGETTAPDEDVPDGLLDSNDNQSMAEQIDEGQRVEGMVGRYYLNESRIGVDPNIDTDVYVLNATAGQTINVSGSLASAFVSLSAPDGTVLANQAQRDIVNEAGTFNLSVVANKTGKYYVEFGFVDPSAPSDAALSGSYSVTYSISNDSGGPRSGGPSKTLTIESTGSERVSYDFTVNGQVELGERANPAGDAVPDSVSGSSASGSVAQNGVDDYRFSGNLTDISVDGPANVYVNDEQIETNESRTNENASETSSEQVTPPSSTDTLSTADPTVAPSLQDTITVKSTGDERAEYQFTVVGNVTYGDNANPVEAEFPDEIDGEIVSGSVAEGGKDNYRFSGVVFQESLYIDGPAEVYINGERFNRETTPDDQTQYMNQIVISEQATSDSATYEFSVTGELQKMDNSSDEVTNGYVNGSVSTESDIYRYTGMIEDFEYSGTPQVFVKGEKVDPAVLAGEKRATTITTTFTVRSTTTQSTVDDSNETKRPTSQTDASGPGFGIVAVVAALAGITLIRTRSLRQL
jgi:PGF-CTERM protein